MQQCGVNDTEKCSRRSDAQRNRQNRDGREARTFAQHAQGKANVLPEIIPPQHAAGFVKSLLSVRHISERASRRVAGFYNAHPVLMQAFYFMLHVRFNFRIKIARLTLPPQHSYRSSDHRIARIPELISSTA